MKTKIPIFPKYLSIFVIGVPLATLTLLFYLAPLAASRESIVDLSGSVIRIDNWELYTGLDPFSTFAYTSGDFLCHQLSERSYFLNGNQIPVCARCLGISTALSVGLIAASYRRFVIGPVMLTVGIAPAFADVLLQTLTVYESSNPVRLITGLISGLTVALVISTIRHEIVDIQMQKRNRVHEDSQHNGKREDDNNE